jgi:hypothetical protein
MASFALVDSSRRPSVRGQILLIVDNRREADEMAFALRHKGRQVDVCEVHDERRDAARYP